MCAICAASCDGACNDSPEFSGISCVCVCKVMFQCDLTAFLCYYIISDVCVFAQRESNQTVLRKSKQLNRLHAHTPHTQSHTHTHTETSDKIIPNRLTDNGYAFASDLATSTHTLVCLLRRFATEANAQIRCSRIPTAFIFGIDFGNPKIRVCVCVQIS